MSFYLRKEWIDQEDGIEQVFIHYAAVALGEQPEWQRTGQTHEMIPEWGHNRHRRAKVLKLPRRLDDQENYHLYYYFSVNKESLTQTTEPFVDEIIADDSFTFIDYEGHYTHICVYWSIDGWGATNYSAMFVDGIRIDHPLSSLHLYDRSHDWEYLSRRFNLLKSISVPHIYRGRVHGPRGSRVDYAYHILCKGSPSGQDFAFWDNNDGLNYWKDLR